MPVFHYKAIDRTGQSVQGRIEAESSAVAAQVLAEQGRFGSEFTDAEESGQKDGQKDGQKNDFSVTPFEIKMDSCLRRNDNAFAGMTKIEENRVG